MSTRYISQRGGSAADSTIPTPPRKPRRQWQLDTTETDVSAKKLLAAPTESPALPALLETSSKAVDDSVDASPLVDASVDNWLPSSTINDFDDSDTSLTPKKERGRRAPSELRASMPVLSSTRSVRRHCIACKHSGATATTNRLCPSPTPGAPAARCTCSRASTASAKGPTARLPHSTPAKPSAPKPAPPPALDVQAVIDHLITESHAAAAAAAKQQQQADTAAGSDNEHAVELLAAVAQVQGTRDAAVDAAVRALQAYLSAGRMLQVLEQLHSLQQRAAHRSPTPPTHPVAPQYTTAFLSLHPALVECALSLTPAPSAPAAPTTPARAPPPAPTTPIAPSTPIPASHSPIPILTQLIRPPPSTPTSPPASPPSSTPFESPASSFISSDSDSQTLSRSHSLSTSHSVTSHSVASSSHITPFLTPAATPPSTSPSTLTPEPSISPTLLHASSIPRPATPYDTNQVGTILDAAEAWFLGLVKGDLCGGAGVHTRSDCDALLKALMRTQDWLADRLAGRRGPATSEAAQRRLREAEVHVREGIIRWGTEQYQLPLVV